MVRLCWQVDDLFGTSDHRHGHLETGKAFVEASYRAGGEAVDVFGSSTKNAEGNYIAWKEVLRRMSS